MATTPSPDQQRTAPETTASEPPTLSEPFTNYPNNLYVAKGAVGSTIQVGDLTIEAPSKVELPQLEHWAAKLRPAPKRA